MPADSDITLPRTWRPLGVRIAGALFGGILIFFCAFAWFALGEETRDKFTFLQRATLIGMGLAIVAALHALGRSRVDATDRGVVVVNGYRRREYEWAQVVAVRLRSGAPWASLDVSDGTTVPVMGIQGSDGPRAVTAVRELRSLVDR